MSRADAADHAALVEAVAALGRLLSDGDPDACREVERVRKIAQRIRGRIRARESAARRAAKGQTLFRPWRAGKEEET